MTAGPSSVHYMAVFLSSYSVAFHQAFELMFSVLEGIVFSLILLISN